MVMTLAAYRRKVDCCETSRAYHHFCVFVLMFHYAIKWCYKLRFYRAIHFSAKRGLAIACRRSVRPSVCDVGRL